MDFLASVPLKVIPRLPNDEAVQQVVSGLTVDMRSFTLLAVADELHPWLAIVLGPAPMDPNPKTTFLRVKLSTFIGRLVESSLIEVVPLDENLRASVDVIRGALAGMEVATTEGSVNGMDVFGETLDNLIGWASIWSGQQAAAESPTEG